MKKVLLINTHLTYPNWTEGKLNQSLIDVAKSYFYEQGYEILETKVDVGYNSEEEVQKHTEAEIIILQMPVNWFGAPWIYKKYVDEVFNVGLFNQKLLIGDGRSKEDPTKQYGSGGLMKGKKFMICATWNAPKEAFDNPLNPVFQGKTTADLFLNISSNYKFCDFEIVPDYNCFDIYRSQNIAEDIENYKTYLKNTFTH
jgi:modulator of drug activity B